jgi:hypothetical protein
MDLGIFRNIEPFVAFGVFVLQSVAGIDGSRVDRHVEFRGCGILFIEGDAAFEPLEDAAGVVAAEGDVIAIGDLPVLSRDKSKGAAGEQNEGGEGRYKFLHKMRIKPCRNSGRDE